MPPQARRTPQEPEVPEIDWVRRHLPWTTAPLLPGGYGSDDFGAAERWTALVAHARGEVEALRAQDAPAAFRCLMQLTRLVERSTLTRGRRHPIDPLLLALREHASSLLHAMVEGGPGTVADRLATALLQVDLDLSLLDDALLGRLAPADRQALLERLLAVNSVPAGDVRMRAMITRVLLGEPDLDRLVEVADRLWLWERIDTAPLLRRLLAEGRAVPSLPQLVARAVLDPGAGEDPRALLDRWLAWCEGSGHVDLAQQIRRGLFTETLTAAFAREWLHHLPPGADRAAEEAWVVRQAQQHPDRGRGLLFLIAWPALGLAAQHAVAHAGEMGGLGYQRLEQASHALERRSPLAALRLMRKACEGAGEVGPRMRAYMPPPGEAWMQQWPDPVLMREADAAQAE